MWVPVEFFVDVRALEAEISAQVNDRVAEVKQRNSIFRGDSVRESEKDDARFLGNKIDAWFGKAQRASFRIVREPWKYLGQGLAGILSGSDGFELGLRMTQQQADEFFAGVTACTNNGNFDC